MKVLDHFKREIKVGDFIAKASLSYKMAHMVVGKVTSISEKGNVTIDKGEKENYSWSKQKVSFNGHNLLWIDPNCLPEEFRSLFV